MEFKVEPGTVVEITEFNTGDFVYYSRTKTVKLLRLTEAIDIYEDDVLNFVIRRHEL